MTFLVHLERQALDGKTAAWFLLGRLDTLFAEKNPG
jgi:hypothetical protein